MQVLRPHLRLLSALLSAVGLEAALLVPFSWQQRLPGLAVAAGVLVAVAAGVAGGPAAGAVGALAGWAFAYLFVADRAGAAVWMLPVWAAGGIVAGAAGELLWRRSRRLRVLERRQVALAAAVGEALVGVDAAGRIGFWGGAAGALYGYAEAEIVGRPLADLFAEAGAAAELLVAAADGEVDGVRAQQRRSDGSVFAGAVTLLRLDDRDANAVLAVVRDVGALTRAQARRRELEGRVRALGAQLPLVLYSRSGDGGLELVGEQAQTQLGYGAEELLAEPQLLLELVHPDDRERVAHERARLPGQASSLSLDYRAVRRDGRTIDLHEQAAVVRDGQGRPLCVQGYLQDVSERTAAAQERLRLAGTQRQAEAETRLRQTQLELLARAAAAAGPVGERNASLRRLSELVVPELAAWLLLDVVDEQGALNRLAREGSGGPAPAQAPDPTAPALLKQRRRELNEGRIVLPLVATGGRGLGVLTLLAGGGRRFGEDDVAWAEALAGIVALLLDNARLSEEVAARADATRVLAHVGEGVFLVDPDGVVRFWNPAAEVITGLEAAAVVGQQATSVIPGWPELAVRIPVAAAHEPAQVEAVALDREGGERWLAISGVSFLDGTVYAFHDITEAHRLEQLQAEFIATASHELRTPLAAVYGAAQTLRRHDFALDEAGRERFIDLIVDESDRLGRIVNQILLANQLDVGRLELDTEPFDAADLLTRVAEAARAHAPENVTIEVVLSEPELPVSADRERVRQILVNLVENAIKYSPEGGRVELGAEPDNGSIRFRVLDEGLGIPADERQRIFGKFYRLDPDMTHGVGGTGLGLYICDELVGRMGGRIWVERRDGPGSAFYFELPQRRRTAGLLDAAARSG